VSAAFSQSPLQQITREDGITKEIRLHDGHLFVCQGCCCGRIDKGFPALPLDEFKSQWKARGIRRRFHLTVSGCLGPCPLANVVMIVFRGQTLWLHSINHAEDVNAIYGYIEEMLRAEEFLEPPLNLARRRFERYVETSPEALGANYGSLNCSE
jgi:cobaltochelatase CobN